MSKLLEIKELYGGYQKGVKVLRGINMHIEQGEAVGILGLNGSGKSTLGKAVMNLLPYRSGTIIFDGKDVCTASTHKLAKMGIAMMHQGGTVFNNLSVWQNLQMAFGTNVDKEYYNQLGKIIPLLKKDQKELMRTMADKLSGGQRHELALAMTLARKPKLVILDEPSAGLSPQAIKEMYSNGEVNQQNQINTSAMCPSSVHKINGILGEVKQKLNISILLIEQNVSRAQSFCDRCVMMEEGRIKREFDKNNSIKEIENSIFDDSEKTKQWSYDNDFWNDIYLKHYEDAPWMNDSWKGDVIRVIEKYFPEKAQSLLDYGCGNGYMGEYFNKKGFKVDLSDISDCLIKKLRLKYSGTSMRIYHTNVPDDLVGEKYDVIIAWSLFHHINPKHWRDFLAAFSRLLKNGGVLVIGGWDEDDIIIREDGNKARYTGRETWYINNLVDMFDYDHFEMLENDVIKLIVPPFKEKRVQHYYILKKKQ